MTTRKDAIKMLTLKLNKGTIVVSSLGMTSRYLYAVNDRPLNFYLVGGMGSSLAVGIGIALNTTRRVIVISGDGDALMSAGTIFQHKQLEIDNLWHFILNNNEHASTGGQSTCFGAIEYSSLSLNTVVIDIEKGKGDAPRIPLTGKQIKERFVNAISNNISL